MGDDDLAQTFGGPVRTDWSGHGSWVGGNIAAARDGLGVNGTAPGIKLVSLKIAGWCGAAYASTVFKALRYAGKHHIDVVNLSLGNYLDRTDPAQDALWRKYRSVIQKVRDQGTVITVAAGNEHLRIDADGQVTSHGLILDDTGTLVDAFGLFEVPGGVPGVIDVASTVNVVGFASSHCPPQSATDLNAVCKPSSDPHQARGQGLHDQLAYYSNYGPRIDVAAPGGARKFNLPGLDRGGTPGFPFTNSDFTTAYQVFSTTSNWAGAAGMVQCFTFSASAFPVDQCYTDMQGTSMAAPHVAGVLALIASSDPSVRGNPERLERRLLSSARKVSGNRTQGWSATDTSPGDLTGVPCPLGYCHLGGDAVKDGDAYGAGIVDARRAVAR
jgi:subtilisin family serine protease